MDTSPSLDEVRAELAAIHDELLRLPADDYTRRVELQDRRNQLRALSHDLARKLPEPARQSLVAEFERLAKARDHILDQLLSPSGESVGDAGVSPAMTRIINDAIESGLGLDEIERQIKSILKRLREQ